MNKVKLSDISRYAKRPLDLWTETVSYWFSVRFVYIIQNMHITPNMLTSLSLLFNLTASFMFFQMNRIYLISGAILFEIAYILDCADGQLARLRDISHIGGAILDKSADRIKEFVVFFSIGLGLFTKTHNIIYFILAFTAFFFTYFNEYIRQQFYLFEKDKLNTDLNNVSIKKGFIKRVIGDMKFKNFNIGEQTFVIFLFMIIGKPTYLLYTYNTIILIVMLLYVYKIIRLSIIKKF